MLMLAKGRTLANKNDEAQDGTPFDIKTANRTGNKENLASLPVKEKEDILQHSPNIEGFNGIEKTFTAFSTKYGSRLKIDFVTGYISDYEGSKGTYRIVVKAIKKDKNDTSKEVEETIYDHTINRIDGIVENEERYSQGVDLSGFNKVIKNLLKDEYIKKVNALANAKYNEKYPGERRDNKKLAPLKEEAKQELVKNGDVIYELPIDKDKLEATGRQNNYFKEGSVFTVPYATVANKLKNILRPKLDAEVQKDSPVWENSSETYPDNSTLTKSKDPDRVYKLLDFVLPTAKKIIYHADTDQLELVTDPDKVKKHRAELETKLNDKKAKLETADETNKTKLNKEISALKAAIGSTNAYTYLEARNGSQEAKILGSYMKATSKPDSSEISEAEYEKYHTNKLAATADKGVERFTGYFVEKNNVTRTDVLPDDKLSEIINTEISGDKDKLGKGGYFSTGDIPLGKDVVAYKIQVFAENEKRVGVNKQSPRLQYNLPILADFSVIQDTVEPSKEVTTRIITKLKEQGKITEDQEKKIKEEIKKSKKTSELRSQLSGDVKVKYQDVNGTLLTLKNTVTGQKETDLGKKGEDGTYLAVDSGLRYTEYNVSDKKLETITASDGKRYRLKRSLDNGTLEEGRLKASAAERGTISESPATVTFVYEEDTTPPAPAEVDATRTVKRTITYVKEDNVNGVIKRTTLEERKTENTVTFTGKEVTNTADNTVSYKDWTSTNSKFPKVDTPVLEGYIADIASVGEEEATAPTSTGEVTNLTKKVVYTKLGNWVPNLPKGVTPPEGTDMTPKPYPNNPNDPTKPGEPTDPNVPVIPYVPGYTPNVGGTPLVPKNPTDLTEGYTPPTPTDPKTNIEINYTPDPQKAVVKVYTIRDGVKIEFPNEKVSIDSGIPDAAIPSTKLDEKIKDLEKRGYIVDNKTPLKGETFDKVKDSETGDPSQVYELILRERTSVETETKSVTRTIKYYKIDETNGTKVEVDNGKLTNTKTAEFTREVTTNLATGLTTIGEWSDKQTLDEVKTPVLTGYIADKVKVPSSEVTADTESFEEEVVYKKIGSWVPKVPGVETPTPLPYPNHPTDPTKPGEPEYPQPGTPVEPNTPKPPVIPYVPGYTPKTPDGNPLVPVDPNNPETGYRVPPIPETPENDTPIEYEKDPQRAVVKVFNTTTGTEVELPKEKVELSGKTGEPIPADSVITKIAELEKRGYTVENKEPLKGATFDKNKDPENGDPTQVFKLLVKERTVEVTTPPTPNTPVDPNIPDGPKWPETGLAKSDLEKEVTRTITYVKKETADGPEEPSGKEPVTQPAHFKRSATYNLVTKVVTPGDWGSTDNTLTAVPTEKLEGYIADRASVEAVTVPDTSGNITEKVVYTKLGSWVPNLPKGVTPPEGTDMTPKPYPNHPTDPTKPGDPTPGLIPYVPGYTPKIGDKPLEPVDPKHPENGYKVPPVPTEPGKDTPIEYVKDGQQKAITSFVDPKGNVLETPITETGDSNTPLTKDGEIKATIAKLKLKGYDVETNTYPPKGTFDNDSKVDQYFKVTLTPRVKPVKPFDPTDPKDLNKPVPGQPIDPDTPVDPNNPNDPTIPRWTEDLINKLETTKQVTRTINYVDEEGNKLSEPSTDKVTFTREAKINVVTGEIAYGDWKAVGGDITFDKVSSPVVKGYILKDPAQKEVAERKGITPTVANQTIEVVYKKLGSWVPKVPGVETPTPLPYPNDPTDPTKPGEPEYPQPGTPVEPNTPVIPYVPGYTPKTPDGNPLVPVDPEHPENGYKVPPVPTEPGKDTPIEYVKVPNTPSPEEPVKPTPESNHITIWVDENGKPLKPEKPGTHEPGNIPGYRYITTVTKDGVTIHRFEKITPVEPNNPVPQKPTTPIPTPQDPTIPTPESQIPIPNTPEANTPTSETSRRVELPNTGTEANATLASVGIMTLLAGLGLGFFKKKEDEK